MNKTDKGTGRHGDGAREKEARMYIDSGRQKEAKGSHTEADRDRRHKKKREKRVHCKMKRGTEKTDSHMERG